MRPNVSCPILFFFRWASNDACLQISPPAHSLNWYRFIGRILGKAMYEGILVDVAFAGFFLAKVHPHSHISYHFSSSFRIVILILRSVIL
jgi:hypothetical protein